MPNFTIEDYKEAIRAKYEKDLNNPLSDDLTLISQARLRDLCWEKFEGDLSEDDLRVFTSFFGFEFNPLKRNLFRDKTDKFRPIGTFLKRQTDLASREAVDLTAILVDFQHRPFRKFREKGVITYLKHPEDSGISDPFIVKDEDGDTVKEKGNCKNEEINCVETFSANNLDTEIVIEDFTDPQSDLIKEVNIIGFVEVCPPKPTKPKNLAKRLKEKISDRFWKRMKITIIGVIITLFSIVTIIHFIFPDKECMIWVKDHYEEEKRSDEGYCDSSYDARYFDLKKIEVCDNTIFFKDGKAVVWYFKSGDSIEFFDRFAPYPNNSSKFLKPVTGYIIGKYVKPCK